MEFDFEAFKRKYAEFSPEMRKEVKIVVEEKEKMDGIAIQEKAKKDFYDAVKKIRGTDEVSDNKNVLEAELTILKGRHSQLFTLVDQGTFRKLGYSDDIVSRFFKNHKIRHDKINRGKKKEEEPISHTPGLSKELTQIYGEDFCFEALSQHSPYAQICISKEVMNECEKVFKDGRKTLLDQMSAYNKYQDQHPPNLPPDFETTFANETQTVIQNLGADNCIKWGLLKDKPRIISVCKDYIKRASKIMYQRMVTKRRSRYMGRGDAPKKRKVTNPKVGFSRNSRGQFM